MSKSNCPAVNAGIVAAKAAASEQGFVKSDKGSGFQHPLKTLNKAQVLFNHIFVLRVGGFADNNYWSSSENSSNNAWKQNFNNGNQNNNNKNNNKRVRAVRGFHQNQTTSG
jgi:hypothetical protein